MNNIMICSNAKKCNSIDCTHKQQHPREQKCLHGTCSRFDGKEVPCQIYDIKFIRKQKMEQLKENNS
jgi:hypothetical protein